MELARGGAVKPQTGADCKVERKCSQKLCCKAEFSTIESEFLLKMGDGTIPDISFLFLDKSDQEVFFCRSFFPMDRIDYTRGQMQYALLKKEKRNLITGQIELQYDRLSPK